MHDYVVSLWCGHDASFCLMSNEGEIVLHTELERHTRTKEDSGDVGAMLLAQVPDLTSRNYKVVLCPPFDKALNFNSSMNIIEASATTTAQIDHHHAHACHAFYSSPFDEAIVLTIDGGGLELDGRSTAVTVSYGRGNELKKLVVNDINQPGMNPGGVWTRVTRYVFGLESGWPQGHQAGTVMSMAAFGDPSRFKNDFNRIMRDRSLLACHTPQGHVKGMSAKDPRVPKHPFLGKWKDLIKTEQDAFDMAAAFQQATTNYILDLVYDALRPCSEERVKRGLKKSDLKNLCIAGGVALNSVAMGKLVELGYNVYVPPVPYDGGLTIGACQHVVHETWNMPRGKHFVGPYLGKAYDKRSVEDAASLLGVSLQVFDDQGLVDRLGAGDVVSVFNGRAESGRRALGNRSILADPRNQDAKDRVNEKVKHRQSHRPFAPSILRERVSEWFEHDIDSPFMSHVIKFKDEKRRLVPAVVHVDGSARLQTVTKEQNEWYHSFLTTWEKSTGIPIILNTSYNDREPIVETPEDAIKCFMKTDIDILYFPEHGLCLKK